MKQWFNLVDILLLSPIQYQNSCSNLNVSWRSQSCTATRMIGCTSNNQGSLLGSIQSDLDYVDANCILMNHSIYIYILYFIAYIIYFISYTIYYIVYNYIYIIWIYSCIYILAACSLAWFWIALVSLPHECWSLRWHLQCMLQVLNRDFLKATNNNSLEGCKAIAASAASLNHELRHPRHECLMEVTLFRQL